MGAFQARIDTDTTAEADAVCADATLIKLSLVSKTGTTKLIDFDAAGLKPNIVQVGDTMLLVQWEQGFPDYETVISIDECFRVRMDTPDGTFYSNIFQRIVDDCYTSTIMYAAANNAYGFNYCVGTDGVEWEDMDNTDILDREILIP